MKNYQIFHATPSGQIFEAEFGEGKFSRVGETLNELCAANPTNRYAVHLNGKLLFTFQGTYEGSALLAGPEDVVPAGWDIVETEGFSAPEVISNKPWSYFR